MTSRFFKFLLFSAALFFGFSSSVFASCFTASGFTANALIDGSYTQTGATFNGQPSWVNGNSYFLYDGLDGGSAQRWLIGTVNGDPWSTGGGTTIKSYGDLVAGAATPDLTTTWTTFTGGSYSDLNGSLASSTCAGGGGGSTTSLDSFGLWGSVVSSTSVMLVSSVPLWELTLGILMGFFLLFFITIGLTKSVKWLLRKR